MFLRRASVHTRSSVVPVERSSVSRGAALRNRQPHEARRRDICLLNPAAVRAADLRVQMSLAESYRSAGQYRDAIPAFEHASALMTDLGRDETQTAGTLFNNWALALQMSGKTARS